MLSNHGRRLMTPACICFHIAIGAVAAASIGQCAEPAITHAETAITHAEATVARAEIRTAETSITLEAGTEAPRMTGLALRGASPWLNQAVEALPAQVGLDNLEHALHWHLDRAASRIRPHRVDFVYFADSPRLRLRWQWRARSAHGPIEHTIRIDNLGDRTIALPLLPSVRYDWQVDAHTALQRFWVEKGGDTPSSEGTHADAIKDGDSWQGTSSTYARPILGEAREMIPYLLVHRTDADQQGWYLGIEFSGRTHITLDRRAGSLRGEAGLNPVPAPYRTRLLPRGRFATPTIFLGASSGGPDGAGNRLRRWVRTVLNNPRTLRNPAYPLTVSNSWGSGMAVDEPLARQMIADAHALGLEMFHLDAGWFRGVGDWYADPAKFPAGLAALAAYAHRLEMKFGLWVDWTQAGVSSQRGALNVFETATRDWLIADPPADWKHSEPFKGVTVDLGLPAVQHWAAQEIERIVREDR